MLVAISGSQGSGKSTILNELEDAGFEVIRRKTSRSILEEWGVSLQEVNNNPELTVRFQDEIIKRKFEDEHLVNGLEGVNTGIRFTERTFADLFTYSCVALGKDNRYSDWLNDYYIECLKHSQIYDHVYYLRAGHFKIEADGVRGNNQHYSRMVDLAMLDNTQQMILSCKLTIVETPDLSQRVNMILAQTASL